MDRPSFIGRWSASALFVVVLAAGCGASGAPTTPAPEPARSESPLTSAPSEVAAAMSPLPSVQRIGATGLGEIAVGECFNEVIDPLDDRVHGADVVPCDGPHQMEMYGHETLPDAIGSPYPGDQAMNQVGDATCRPLFEEYVGIAYDASAYTFWMYTPDEHDWDYLRRVDCALGNAEQSMQPPGSARGSHK